MVKRQNNKESGVGNQPIDVSWYFRDVFLFDWCFSCCYKFIGVFEMKIFRFTHCPRASILWPFFASQCIARTVFTQLSKTKSSLTKGKYSFSHNHGSVANDPQMKGKSSLEIHSLSTGCHDYGRKGRNQQFPGGTPLLFLIHPRSQTTKPVCVTWDSSKKIAKKSEDEFSAFF